MDLNFVVTNYTEKSDTEHIKLILEKYKEQINEEKYDELLEEMFLQGGMHYVEITLNLFKTTGIIISNPLYQISDGHLYKRIV